MPGANGSPASWAARTTRGFIPGETPKSAPTAFTSRAVSGVRIVPTPTSISGTSWQIAVSPAIAASDRKVSSIAVMPPSSRARAIGTASSAFSTEKPATTPSVLSCRRISFGNITVSVSNQYRLAFYHELLSRTVAGTVFAHAALLRTAVRQLHRVVWLVNPATASPNLTTNLYAFILPVVSASGRTCVALRTESFLESLRIAALSLFVWAQAVLRRTVLPYRLVRAKALAWMPDPCLYPSTSISRSVKSGASLERSLNNATPRRLCGPPPNRIRASI